ncbi:hypothetical protein QTN25_009352 [Entamoeba marina]
MGDIEVYYQLVPHIPYLDLLNFRLVSHSTDQAINNSPNYHSSLKNLDVEQLIHNFPSLNTATIYNYTSVVSFSQLKTVNNLSLRWGPTQQQHPLQWNTSINSQIAILLPLKPTSLVLWDGPYNGFTPLLQIDTSHFPPLRYLKNLTVSANISVILSDAVALKRLRFLSYLKILHLDDMRCLRCAQELPSLKKLVINSVDNQRNISLLLQDVLPSTSLRTILVPLHYNRRFIQTTLHSFQVTEIADLLKDQRVMFHSVNVNYIIHHSDTIVVEPFLKLIFDNPTRFIEYHPDHLPCGHGVIEDFGPNQPQRIRDSLQMKYWRYKALEMPFNLTVTSYYPYPKSFSHHIDLSVIASLKFSSVDKCLILHPTTTDSLLSLDSFPNISLVSSITSLSLKKLTPHFIPSLQLFTRLSSLSIIECPVNSSIVFPSSLTSLHLNNLSLSSLSCSELPNLQNLHLCYMVHLTTLSLNVTLTNLQVYYCQHLSLPRNIKKCTNLSSLICEGMKGLNVQYLCKLKLFTHMSLNATPLLNSDQFLKLTHLKSLNLDTTSNGYDIITIPDSIQFLTTTKPSQINSHCKHLMYHVILDDSIS